MRKEKEIWKIIPGFEDRYSVSSLGRVRSEKFIDSNGHLHKQRIRKIHINKVGYYNVGLHINGSEYRFDIHRLVASAFIPNPDNLPVVNHKDTNKLNNKASNLEWCTQKDNVNYVYIKEKVLIPVLQYSKEGELIKEWESVSHVSKFFGKKMSQITSCCRGKLYSAYGYIWRYKNSEYFDRPEGLAKPKGHQFKKPVLQLDMNLNLIKRFECAKDAEEETGVHNSKISMCCNGLRSKAGGFKWRFDKQNK